MDNNYLNASQSEWLAVQAGFESGEYNMCPLETLQKAKEMEEVEEEEEQDILLHDYFGLDWEERTEDTNEDVPDDFGELMKPHLHSYSVSKSDDWIAAGDKELFENSEFRARDICRSLLNLKSMHSGMGTRLFSSIVGSFLTFLPKDNVLRSLLTTKPTMYCLMKMVESVADVADDLRTFKVDTCKAGCRPFWGTSVNMNICLECRQPRWKHCVPTCFDATGHKNCNHDSIPWRTFFSLSVRDRIQKLLDSDLFPFFEYESLRHNTPQPNFIEDIYDSKTYLKMKSLLPPNGKLIFIQICWDGADMFNYSGKSMWPLCYSIMNLPPTLRDKPHVGKYCITSFYVISCQ